MIFGTHEQYTLDQFNDIASRAELAALMSDGHGGYVMPIGGVAAYKNKVSVVGVGVDVSCGNYAVKTNKKISDYTPTELQLLADQIKRVIIFGAGGTNKSPDAPRDHPLFEDPEWEAIPEDKRTSLRDTMRNQLGTAGSGNHYMDVFVDEAENIWVGTHFGSRGLGFKGSNGFLALSQNRSWSEKAPEIEVLLDLSTPLGQAYWSFMTLGGKVAYAGREWAVHKVVSLLGAEVVDSVHNNHNFAWKETHFGQEYVVIRKGATPAWPGQRGFVGGSMGDQSVILEGSMENSDLQQQALYSTVHGAGRVMGRQDAIKGRKILDGEGKVIGRDKTTAITREMQSEWTKGLGVIVRGGGVDEAPQAYRRLPEVLAAQGDTIKILHTLTPLIVVMDD